MVDCLETLVGLSDRDCNCFDDGERPADYNTSGSGYYLTDYEDGFPLIEAVFSVPDCGDSSAWAMLTRARQQAVRDFETHLLAQIYATKESRFSPFKGPIGQTKSSSTVTASQTFAGIELDPKWVRGGYIVLNEICLGVDTTGSVDVEVYSSADLTTPITTEIVSTVAGQFACKTLSTALELPMWSDTGEDLKYYFVYDPTGISPLNNKFTCCNKTAAFRGFTKATGIQTSDLENVQSRSAYAFGLSLNVHMQCKELDWLCNLDELAEYSAKQVIAKTILFKGAAKLISAVLESGSINRYTLLSREEMYSKRNALNQNFKINIEWISDNIPQNLTDCFRCNDNRIRKSQILV